MKYNPWLMSVTNDVEAVVEELVEKYGNKRIFYMDTDSNIDEILHNDGVFVDFAPVPDSQIVSEHAIV
jgi:hypothetical protein